MTPEDFAAQTNVSRETLDRLRAFAALLTRWQERMNLVAPESLNDLWSRHILDSAQLVPFIPSNARVADLGSGGGFPGIILGIMGIEELTLIESNQRKCAFLREAARATGIKPTIVPARIEEFSPPVPFDVITARALAPLEKLIDLAAPLLKKSGFLLLLKGRLADEELTVAGEKWNMSVKRSVSMTDQQGVILKIQDLVPKGQL